MTDRITADILVEAFDLAMPDFNDLKGRIEEAAAAHKTTVTVDGRMYPAPDAPTAAPPAPSAPADRDLRDRIRRAICEADGFAWDPDVLEPDEYGGHADAVLAVHPAPADRAAVLREAADAIAADNDRRMWASKPGQHWAADLLRRMADEAQQAGEDR